jgi:hypothetical protein
MIEIKGVGPGGPILPEEVEKDRLKEIKTRLGKIAWTTALGQKAKISSIHQGIAKSEGALKWIEEVINKEQKWKDS